MGCQTTIKRWIPLIVLVVLILSFWPNIPSTKAGGIYYVSNWDETIIVNEDASIEITERVTFSFESGDFGATYREVINRGFDEIKNIRVTDENGNNIPYTLSGGHFFQDYMIEWEWQRIYIGSEPIEKTFILQYTLTNAMNFENSIPDRDRLYLNIVTNYDVPIMDMNIDVTLPSSYPLYDVHADAYSNYSVPERPNIIQKAKTVVSYEHRSYDQPWQYGRGDYYRIDIYFPATVKRYTDPLSQIALLYPILIIPASVGLLGFVYYRKRKDPHVEAIAPMSELKQSLKPAEAGALMCGRILPAHFAATALSLAEQGYLEIETKFGQSQPTKKPKLHEIKFNETEKAVDLDTKTADGLKDFERLSYHKFAGMTNIELERQTKSYYEPVSKEIKSSLVKEGYLEPEKVSDKLFFRGIIVSFVLLALSLIISGFYLLMLWLLLEGILTFVPAFLSYYISRIWKRTEKGTRFKKGAEVYMNSLRDEIERATEDNPLSAADQIKNNASWLILGVSSQWMQNIMEKLEKRISEYRFELPSYIKPPIELLPIMTTSALLLMFETYRRNLRIEVLENYLGDD